METPVALSIPHGYFGMGSYICGLAFLKCRWLFGMVKYRPSIIYYVSFTINLNISLVYYCFSCKMQLLAGTYWYGYPIFFSNQSHTFYCFTVPGL